VAYEIHPETPPDGVLLADRFRGANLEGMFANLRRAGAPYGIEFGEVSLLSNSRLALLAGEFARDLGRFHEFHGLVFEAYFNQGLDIGDVDVLLDLVGRAGLDPEACKADLSEKRYHSRLEAARNEALERAINAVPAFFIGNEGIRIVGAQPIENFRQALAKVTG